MHGRSHCTFAAAVAMAKRAFTSSLTVHVCAVILVATASIAEAQARSKFDLPPQPLADSLRAVGSQANINVLFDPPLVADHQAPALKGEYTSSQAFTLLLVGTHITHEFMNDHTVVLAPAIATSVGESSGTADRRAPRSGKEESSENVSFSSLADSARSEHGAAQSEGQGFWQRFRLAQAQSAASSSSSGLPRNDSTSTATLEEIVVTAQKRAENLQDVPISISVLSGTDLDKSTVEGISEALNQVPGIATTSFFLGGGTQIAVRGVASGTGLFSGSSPVAYYLDSIPFGLVKSAIAPDSAAYDLSRVEVLRGPQGTLYGANALNGVVRVLTADADLNQFELKARTSGSDTKDGGASYRVDSALNVPIVEGKLGARAVVGYQNLGGWIDKPNKKDANDAELRNMRLKVNAQPTDQLAVGLTAWLSRADYGAPPYSPDGERNLSQFDELQAIDYDAYGLKATYDFDAFSVSSMTGYLDYESSAAVDLRSAAPPPLPNFTRLASKVLSQEITLNSHDDGAWRWSAGAFYRDGEDRLQQVVPNGILGVDYFDGSESYAAFGEVRQRFLGNRFEWTMGLRYFHDDVVYKQNALDTGQPAGTPLRHAEASFHSISPRAVLTWFPSSNLTAYVSYSEGFRSGSPQNQATLRVAPTFPPTEPDELRNYEIGSKAELWDGRVALEAAVYYIDWQDIQERVSIPFGPITVGGLINAASASGIGTDLGVTAQLMERLQVGLSFSWNDLTLDDTVISAGGVLFREGDRRSFSPEYTAAASLDYAFSFAQSGLEARFSASGNYTSEQDQRLLAAGAAQAVIFRGDPMLIARTSFSVGGERWEATAFVDNVNNEQGKPIRQPGNPNWDICVRPRTVGLQLDYRF